MINKNFFFLVLSIAISILIRPGYAQNETQTIKGKVFDSESRVSLPGATVMVLGSDPQIGTTTNIDGYFKLKEVPVGRITLQISFVG